jgi:hypothetical protein
VMVVPLGKAETVGASANTSAAPKK